MPCYFFDIRDGEQLVPDDDGLDLATAQAAWAEAALSLADLAVDAIQANERPCQPVAIEVRDENGPVLVVRVAFEAQRRKH